MYEANFCENINKKYIFQLEKMLITKKILIFVKKLILNLYVVQDLLAEIIGKYKKKQLKTLPDFMEKKAFKLNESKDNLKKVLFIKKKKY